MITKLVRHLVTWLFGKPLRSKVGKWGEGILLAIFAISLIYGSIWGPLVVFMPFSPPGFLSLSDGTNTVYFQEGDGEKAKQILQQTQDAQLAVLHFWEGSAGHEFPQGGVRVYLCNSVEYHRFTLNRSSGCAILGKAVYLDVSKQVIRKATPNDLRHELSHIYVARHLGMFNQRFAVPRWFGEGCAATLGDLPWQSPRHLTKYLADSPGLTNPLDLESLSEWGAVFRNGNTSQLKQYAHARGFVEHLATKHGQQKLVEYLHKLSFSSSPASRFEEVFGVPLDVAHESWLSAMQDGDRLPRSTNVVRAAVPTSIRIKAAVELVLAVVVLLWLIRQLSRMVRLTARLVPKKTKEDS